MHLVFLWPHSLICGYLLFSWRQCPEFSNKTLYTSELSVHNNENNMNSSSFSCCSLRLFVFWIYFVVQSCSNRTVACHCPSEPNAFYESSLPCQIIKISGALVTTWFMISTASLHCFFWCNGSCWHNLGLALLTVFFSLLISSRHSFCFFFLSTSHQSFCVFVHLLMWVVPYR